MGQQRYKQPYLKGYLSVSKTVLPFIISCKFLNLFSVFNRSLFFTVFAGRFMVNQYHRNTFIYSLYVERKSIDFLLNLVCGSMMIDSSTSPDW